jgi:hypothetical protein
MVDEGDRPDDVDPTGQWGQICLRFHDLRRKQQVLGVAMQSIDDHVAELARRGIAEDDQRSREYVCPDGRCSRRAAALFDEAPTCELLGRPMEKSQP